MTSIVELPINKNNNSATPGFLQVIKRHGNMSHYDDSKIAVAITKAFLAIEGNEAAHSGRIHEIVGDLTAQITAAIQKRHPSGGIIHIEDIQDQVELALMRSEYHRVARAYVLYRDERRKMRANELPKAPETNLTVTLKDGRVLPLDVASIQRTIITACENLSDVNSEIILKDTLRSLFDGVPIQEVNKAMTLTARALIEKDPNYSFVAARLLLHDLYTESLGFLGHQQTVPLNAMQNLYATYFPRYIERGIELELLDPKLREFDLDVLSQAIQGKRDFDLTYLSVQTLYDRYFLHSRGTRFEIPQFFFMRIAMGLALGEKSNPTEHAIDFYNLLSSRDYMCSTPTLFNAGTLRSQLSSCFLTTIPDDLEGIYNSIRDNALLSKFAGGIGNDWTPVRGIGARIKGTNGKSLGVVPFMNVADATAIAVNQGGKRKGAVCAYLETWHMDIEEFLELRKNTGDERRRTHDMNTANWVPDLFMQRVFEKANWTLFSPDEVPDLHEKYGQAFTEAYINYEAKAARGEIRGKTISALALWRKMLGMLFETGHPWLTFKDPCNLRSPQQHAGVIHSSNLCTEITLNTSAEEVAVCNLGSINLVNHMTKKGLNVEKIKQTVKTAIRMLDNVIDINYYTIPQAKRSNLRHRPIGLGLMGFQDALYMQNISYASEAAVEFADRCMEVISYYAIQASATLAHERGAYASFDGSLWSQGVLPIDSIQLLKQQRGDLLEQDTSSTLDWDSLREFVKKNGMRNSNTMAIAPTATISNICGVTQSIEPTYQNLYVKSNMSGEFTVVNPYLVKDLKALGLWDDVMVNDLKYYNGSLSKIERIPHDLKALYATAFEVPPKWLIEAASRRQKWIDQAQSLNLYMAEPSGKKLDVLYRMAWLRGLKTTYYLRSLGATSVEKSTLSSYELNAVQAPAAAIVASAAPAACSLDDPDCEACQ